MQEKEEQTELAKPMVEEATDVDENASSGKKYLNGKVRRAPKKQTHYFEDEE
jgi:hypothetical protein